MKRDRESCDEEERLHVWSDVIFLRMDPYQLLSLRSINKQWNERIPLSIQQLPRNETIEHVGDLIPFRSLQLLGIGEGSHGELNFWKSGGYQVFGRLTALHIKVKKGDVFYQEMFRYVTNLTSLKYDSGDKKYTYVGECLTNLLKLKHLEIHDDFTSGYNSLSAMTNLETLVVDIRPRNSLEVSLRVESMVCCLTGLKCLVFKATCSDFSYLKHLTNLQYLALNNIDYSTTHNIENIHKLLEKNFNLPHLHTFFYYTTASSYEVGWALSLPSLRDLHLSGGIPTDMSTMIENRLNVVFIPDLKHVHTNYDTFLKIFFNLPDNINLSFYMNCPDGDEYKKRVAINYAESVKYARGNHINPSTIYSPLISYLRSVLLASNKF
jgi:hypothetical protein